MVTEVADAPQGHLVEKYEMLLARLSVRLGSRDKAQDALQDAYVRLSVNAPQDEVRNPTAYLFRMALESRGQCASSGPAAVGVRRGDGLAGRADSEPGPAEIAEARSDLAIVKTAMAAMSPRRLAICTAAWVDGASTAEIAEKQGMAQRTVQHELKRAAEALQQALNQPRIIPLRNRASGVS